MAVGSGPPLLFGAEGLQQLIGQLPDLLKNYLRLPHGVLKLGSVGQMLAALSEALGMAFQLLQQGSEGRRGRFLLPGNGLGGVAALGTAAPWIGFGFMGLAEEAEQLCQVRRLALGEAEVCSACCRSSTAWRCPLPVA
ncbi:MAG: hypothetical protein R3F17_04455 [Planctomycetota bacterium]